MNRSISQAFTELVELRYQIYNGLFMTLPLDAVQQTGVWLPLLQEACADGFRDGANPDDIIRDFFSRNQPDLNERDQIDFLFKVIQYVERQIVLVDALEDSAYNEIHRVTGPDSWGQLVDKARGRDARRELVNNLHDLNLRVVLTAHPTQFYPGTVLAIISDLASAITRNQTAEVRDLLDQLGRTSFFRKRKPTPLDEAMLLMNYLRQVFYPAVGNLLDEVSESFPQERVENPQLLQLGFWPGGDRDGNPFVTVDVTRAVAAELRTSILRCYLEDVRQLTRRLTFPGTYSRLIKLENRLRDDLHGSGEDSGDWLDELKHEVDRIEHQIRHSHHELFLDKLLSFKRKVHCFGFHFASLDLRQDSRVIQRTMAAVAKTHDGLLPDTLDEMEEAEQIETLLSVTGDVDPALIDDDTLRDTVRSVGVIREIQRNNGEAGAHRYIISNCRGALDIARLIALFRLGGWGDDELTVDIVPLFETVSDLRGAAASMSQIYDCPAYRAHLERRGMEQTVMLGFSDGTKDGGYLMANWAIYTAKESVTAVSREAGVTVHFFDGRGGPPARGGGNSHLFYAALGPSIERKQIQLTIQGQTISSHYGIVESAMHNLELVLTGGLKSRKADRSKGVLTSEQRDLFDEMAAISYDAYEAFKNHPLFIPYLLERSTLRYYGMANIGSRPSKRGDSDEFHFEDLRAIPFVGAWSQLKQNVPGFYGLGTALKRMEDDGRLDDVIRLYREATLFRAFVANSMQSMSKTNFAITRYMEEDERFGEFWRMIHNEFELTRRMVLTVSGQSELLEDNPRSRRSIDLRERIVLPLLTIQQYALIRIQQAGEAGDDHTVHLYEKMVMRSLFGNINATRNAV